MTTTPFQDSATQLIERYKSLLDHIEKRFFGIKTAKVLEWPDLEHRPKWQAVLISFFFPYFFLPETGPLVSFVSFIAILIWLFCSLIWIGFSVIRFDCAILVSAACAGTSQKTSSSSSPFDLILVICILMLALVPYGQLIWFLFNHKNSRQSKIIWLSGFIALMMAAFFMSRSYYLTHTTIAFQANLANIISLAMIAFFFLPALIFVYSFLILSTLYVFTYALRLLKGLFWFSKPIALDILEQLIFEPIKMNEVQWQFHDLSVQEIRSLREWAQQNLEINEKKNIPVAIMLAVAGLLVSTPPAQKFLGDLIQDRAKDVIQIFTSPTHLSAINFGSVLTTLTTMMVIVFLLVIWTVHLQNFTIQGAVVQVCIVAEYAKERQEAQAQQKTKKSSMLQSFFDWVMKWL